MVLLSTRGKQAVDQQVCHQGATRADSHISLYATRKAREVPKGPSTFVVLDDEYFLFSILASTI